MSPSKRSHLSPEAEHLAEQERVLGELVERLAAKEADFAETGAAFARFRAEYLRRFAPIYVELDGLERRIAERLAQDDPTPAATATATAATFRAAESQRLLEEATAGPPDAMSPSGDEGPSDDLRSIYRDAAKRIHPDLATDDDEKARRHGLMAALNAAYGAGDIDAIQRILDGEDSRPEAIVGDGIMVELQRVIRRIRQVHGRFKELEQLEDVRRSDPLFTLFEGAREAWQEGHDALAEDEAYLRRQIRSAEARLAALLRAPARQANASG